MPFKKGTSGNPNGRPQGSTNNNIKDLRERISLLLDSQFDTIITDLNALEPKERISAYIKLIEYAVPKLQRTDFTEQGTSLESLLQLDPLERKQRINEIRRKTYM